MDKIVATSQVCVETKSGIEGNVKTPTHFSGSRVRVMLNAFEIPPEMLVKCFEILRGKVQSIIR